MALPPKKRNYSDLTKDVIAAYGTMGNILTVSRHFHISPNTTKKILDENGIAATRRRGREARPKCSDKCCFYCRGYSRTSHSDGYCLTHHRHVERHNEEPCFH